MFLNCRFFFPAFKLPPCLMLPGGAFISEDDRCTVWRSALSRLLLLSLRTVCHLMALLAAIETMERLLTFLCCWRIGSRSATVRASFSLAKHMLYKSAHEQTSNFRITFDLPPFASPLPLLLLLWESCVALQTFHL